MNIQPSVSAASAAGTARAASKGGEADKQASEATARQGVQTAPGGKRPDPGAVEGGERLGDRGGDGRQLYDRFEQAGEDEHQPRDHDEAGGEHASAPPPPGAGSHLDVEA